MTAESVARSRARGGPTIFEEGSRLDPFQVLAAEHALIRLHLARAIDRATGDAGGEDARRALAVLADSFRLHERREDRVLYPECERLFGGRDGAASVLREDHEAIRGCLKGLLVPPARLEPVSLESLDTLRGLLEGHFIKEERVLFPLMSAYLAGKESARLARRLRATSLV